MACNQCIGIEEEFGASRAKWDLKRYRKRGPKTTTRWLIEAVRARGVEGSTLLDIGGGVGEIQHELAAAGVGRITGVDASSAYIDKCRAEAEERGYADQAQYVHGNFAELSDTVEEADVVTLDRVICCFDDVDALVDRSASKTRRLYGLVFPRETWWTALGFRLINFVQRVRRSSFFVYLHSSEHVDGLIARHGLGRVFYRSGFVWQVVLYESR